jgi:hypothetical protein
LEQRKNQLAEPIEMNKDLINRTTWDSGYGCDGCSGICEGTEEAIRRCVERSDNENLL